MALVHENIADFVLYPRGPSYTSMGSEADINGLNPGFEPYTAMPNYPPPAYYYNQPHYPFESSKSHEQQRFTPARSPSPSMSQALEHPPSTTLSSASGASVQSTTSSAVGSPYTHATHNLPSQDQWTESHHGLGIASGVVHSNDGFGQDMAQWGGIDDGLIYDSSKLQDSFVGESEKVLLSPISSSCSVSFPVPSCSAQQDYLPAFPLPSKAIASKRSGDERDITIDTILEEANSKIQSPCTISPATTCSTMASPVAAHVDTGHFSPPIAPNPFKSPTTPASAMSPFLPSAAFPPRVQRGSRGQSVMAGRAQKASTSPIDRYTPYKRQTVAAERQEQISSVRSQSSFFGQSSGRFIAPLESSCWFSLRALVLYYLYERFSITFSYSVDLGKETFADESALSDPSLIQPFDTPITQSSAGGTYPDVIHTLQHIPSQTVQPPSPTASEASSHESHYTGPARFRSGTASPYLHSASYHPYANPLDARRMSVASSHSRHSQESSRSASIGFDDDGRERGRCPNPDCGRIFKDLKAHMLTHQSERPEKCPIITCEYHQKGFARKYDKNRHTLTHYKGTMVCDFCPGSGSAAEKSFNRADVFKRHLTSVHGVEQTPPNSRKKSPSTSSSRKTSSTSHDAAGKCSTCSAMFHNAQEFYEHLDDCVLRVVQQEEPSEAINEQRLSEVVNDRAVQDTMERNMIPASMGSTADDSDDDDADETKEESAEDGWQSSSKTNPRSGKGCIKSNKNNSC